MTPLSQEEKENLHYVSSLKKNYVDMNIVMRDGHFTSRREESNSVIVRAKSQANL